MNKFIFKFFIISICILTFCPLYGCLNSLPVSSSVSPNDLIVHFINVDQGDSILVQLNNINILIDSGSNEYNSKLKAYLKKENIKNLNYIIATHPHEDHIGSMPYIIKNLSFDNFYAPKVSSNTPIFKDLTISLKHKNKKINIISAGSILNIGDDISCEFLSPQKNKIYDNLNNYSAVIKLKYKNNSFLFMGDAETEIENALISNNINLKCDVLKIGHHGSSSSSSKTFLDKAQPKYSIISCGKYNKYGHPNKETLSKLKDINTNLLRTDIDNNIILISDGNTLKYQTCK
jgi:competence protein ComEC